MIPLVAAVIACVPPREPPPSVWVEIPSDLPVEAIAESLVSHGIIRSAERFVQMARYRDRVDDIKPGLYPLQPDSREHRVLRALLQGRPPAAKMVIRERMTLLEVAQELELRIGLPRSAVVAAAADVGLRMRLGTTAPTVEGYLYPTAYYVNLGASPLEVLRQMADTFAARWRPEWDARLDTLGFSRDEIVILGSIIAGEMPLGEERFLVSSTYHNRLSQGMRLQADPTVVYALGTRRRLTFEDYLVKSPYNTYAITGLPPGPIGQPAVESIEAALYPAETEYLYMVAQSDSSHAFTRTYVEHLRTIRRIRNSNGTR